MTEKTVTLTPEELETLMSGAIKRAFTEMGIDTKNPSEQQRDMAHLRRWRLAVDKTTQTTWSTVLVVLVTGILGAVWLGIQTLLHNRP